LFLEKFIREELTARGFSRAMVGLSGGLDSAVAAFLTVRAIGEGNVTFLIMPYKKLSGEDTKDAVTLARYLKADYKVVEISSLVDGYYKLIKDKRPDQIRRGNKIARERMSILYDFSKKLNSLVVGTSNRTELLLGYGTIYGDLGCAFMPLAGLFKTQVYQLAKFLGIPEKILKKVPSARLWIGQTDEGELGISYEKVDRLLYLMIDKKLPFTEITKMGFSEKIIKRIDSRIFRNIFKLRLPPVAILPPDTFIKN
jgi:NAD+ synthase